MPSLNRPYLVAPKLIEQPTWGGEYIVAYKNWQSNPSLVKAVIGQSYELYGESKLYEAVLSSLDSSFIQEMTDNKNTFNIASLIQVNPEAVLGKAVVKKTGNIMPLLIKFTQAKGNSFQLHKIPTDTDAKWTPKAESWYFFEDGTITFGLAKNVDIKAYKDACLRIEAYMKSLSQKVQAQSMNVADARVEARVYIAKENPWQYVQVHMVKKGALIDLSGGGLHHSWEEDPALPFGNVVYEVQQDVADDATTIRSFDQGKIKDDGNIRKIHIDDYFRHIDTDPVRNDIAHATRAASGESLLSTKYYSMDELRVKKIMQIQIKDSFEHLFVKEGAVKVHAGDVTVILTKGHSCFLPYAVGSYTIEPNSDSIILKTFIQS